MPYYSAGGSAIATAAGGQSLALRAPAGNHVRLAELRIFANAATLTRLSLNRTSPISTAGTTQTIQKLRDRDRAAGATVATGVTVGTITAGDLFNWAAAAAGAGVIWLPPDDLIIPPAGEVVLRSIVAGSAIDVGVIFEE